MGILRPDSFISVLRVFNFFDLKNKGIDNLYFDYKIRNEIQETEIGSFLRFPSLILFTSPSLGDYNGFIEGRIELHKRLHKYELVFDICDRYLQRKLFDPSFSIILDSDLNDLTPEKDNEAIILRKIAIKKTNEMILNLIAKIGFHFFNIPYLREHLSDLVYRSYIPEHSKILKQIRELFFVHIEKNRNIVTDKQYWFYYCLVAKLKERGYKIIPACKILSTLLGAQWTHLRTRYYEKNKEVRTKYIKFNLDKFILEQGFADQIYKYLVKVESVK